MATPGYSGKTAAEKLGIGIATTVYAIGISPEDYRQTVEGIPSTTLILPFEGQKVGPKDILHGFFARRTDLGTFLLRAPESLEPGSILWVSWPKKSSKVETDLTEQTFRDLILPTGLVDVKVCAVNEVWSGLKFLWRTKKA